MNNLYAPVRGHEKRSLCLVTKAEAQQRLGEGGGAPKGNNFEPTFPRTAGLGDGAAPGIRRPVAANNHPESSCSVVAKHAAPQTVRHAAVLRPSATSLGNGFADVVVVGVQ